MIRTLLATTAIASMIATGALAQTSQTQNAKGATQADPANPAGLKSANDVKASPSAQSDGHLATQLMGKSVYNGNGKDAKDIGDINDMVIGDDGKINSVVVGVGGFLGMGEKNVAIDYGQVKWEQRDGAWTIVVPTTADQLKALPDFDRSAYNAAPVAGTGKNAATVNDNQAAANGTAATGAAGTAAAPSTADASSSETTASVDKDSLKKVDVGTISANDLIGTTVYGADNADVGSIDDVVLKKNGKIDAIVLDVGGFLGMGTKKVAVGMDNLQFLADKNGKKYLYTHFTKDRLESQPAYDKKTYAANRDKQRLTVR